MEQWLQQISEWLVNFVEYFGYGGIFVMTALESTFVPIPSEATMIPAGYLAQQGKLDIGLLYLASILGTLAGSMLNYYVAAHFGRRYLAKYGHYFLLPPEKLAWIENYFRDHGEISIFTGRLIPGVRHFISFPAGLAHMPLGKFCFYTGLGGGIWMAVLLGIGYTIGGNKELVHEYMPIITYCALAGVALLGGIYVWRHRRMKRGENT